MSRAFGFIQFRNGDFRMMKYNERLDKIISSTGRLTRSGCKKAASQNRITVDGKIERKYDRKVNETNVITLDGQLIEYKPYIYLLLNKPLGYVCSNDEPGEKIVFDLLEFPYNNLDLFCVGRLDKSTSGLILLTNDGKNAHTLLSPKHHVEKEYIFRCARRFAPTDAELLSNGITLADGYTTMPCIVEFSDDLMGGRIILREGKYHQIRRMMASVGNHVESLERIRFGSIHIDDAPEQGKYRELTDEEIDSLLR